MDAGGVDEGVVLLPKPVKPLGLLPNALKGEDCGVVEPPFGVDAPPRLKKEVFGGSPAGVDVDGLEAVSDLKGVEPKFDAPNPEVPPNPVLSLDSLLEAPAPAPNAPNADPVPNVEVGLFA